MGQIQLRICRIAGVALYSTKSEHPLPQRPDQFYVLYFIYVAVVLPLVNKSLFHSDQLFCNHVGCKGKGKSKKSPSFLFPKFHAISSFCIWWIRYSSSRHSSIPQLCEQFTRGILQTDFHASMRSAHRNVRVNCSIIIRHRDIFFNSSLHSKYPYAILVQAK